MRIFNATCVPLLLACLSLLETAAGNFAIDNSDFEQGATGWVMVAPWIISEKGARSPSKCAVLDYKPEPPNKILRRAVALAVTPLHYYRATIWCQTEAAHDAAAPSLMFYAAHPAPPNIPLLNYATSDSHSFWNRIVHYFNSGENDTANLLFFPQGGSASKIFEDDLELYQLSDDDLAGNLLPNADFEEGTDNTLPCMWRIRVDHAKIPGAATPQIACDTTAAFIKGTKSLRVDGSTLAGYSARQYGVESILVPAVTGRQYVFTVWLKAVDGEPSVRLLIDGWVQKHIEGQWQTMPHWYKETYVKATSEWRRHSLKVMIPGEEDKTLFLPERLARVIILVKGKGAVWVDECRLQQE